MQKSITIIVFVLIAVVAGVGGFFANKYFMQATSVTPSDADSAAPARNQVTSKVVGKPRPAFNMLDLEEVKRTADEFDGKVVLVNFWATWCPPCVKEMPALNKLYLDYKDKGFVILGIALDTRDDVEQFVDPMGIDYLILLGEEQGLELSLRFGNRLGVLPFTAIVGRDGNIAITHPGEITYEDATDYLKSLL